MRLHGISSMATRNLLRELCAAYLAQSGVDVQIESVGGVDAAKRVAAGESFDVVILGSDAIEKLVTAGHLLASSRVDLAKSPISIAIKSGAPRADISSASSLKDALLKAKSIGYSTGPSGVYLAQLFDQMRIGETIKIKTMVPPPGVPVGGLVAQGAVEMGFQQRCELINMEGIEVLGNLPDEVACITTFSAGIPVGANAALREAACQFLSFANSPQVLSMKLSQGMSPATNG